MAWVLRQSTSAVPADWTGTAPCAFVSPVLSGSLLVAVCQVNGDPVAAAASDTLGSTYATRVSFKSGATGVATVVCDAIAASGGANTITVNPGIGATDAWSIQIMEFTGGDAASRYIDVATGTFNGTTVSTAALNPGAVNGVLFVAVGEGQATMAVSAPFTGLTAPRNTRVVGYYEQASAASLAANFTDGAGVAYAYLVAYRPASGGGGGPSAGATRSQRINQLLMPE